MIDQFGTLFPFLSIKYHIDMHYINIRYGWPTLFSKYFCLLNIIFNLIFNLCFRLSSMESIGDEVHFILY